MPTTSNILPQVIVDEPPGGRSDTEPADAGEPQGSARERVRALADRFTRAELGVLVLVGLSPLSASARYSGPIAQRIALAAVLGVIGVALVARSAARERDRAAWALLAFFAVAVVAALLSPTPWQSLHGSYNTHLSVFAFVVALGWWGLGRSFRPTVVEAVPWVLLPGAVLNVVVAFAQVSARSSGFPGRGSGLMANPVYFGSFVTGLAVWSVAAAPMRTRPKLWMGLVGLLGAATGISGSRAAAIGLFLGGIAAVAILRHRRVLVAFAVSLVGLVAASLYGSWLASAGTVERLGDTAGGFTERVDVWGYGLRAFTERPIVGWGLGHYATATQRYFTPEFIRAINYDDLSQPYTDPHNLFVTLLTSTGVLGVLAFGAFIVLGTRGVRNTPLLLAASGIAITWGLQPSTVHSLPVCALLFGAAVRPVREPAATPRPSLRLPRAATLLALTVAAYLLAADTQLRLATNGVGDIERALSWYHDDPVSASVAATYYRNLVLEGDESAATEQRMLEWSDRAVAWEPGSARAWTFLADNRFVAGDLPGTKAALDRAIEIQPYNPTAWRLTLFYARVDADADLEREAMAVVCELGLDLCEQRGPVQP